MNYDLTQSNCVCVKLQVQEYGLVLEELRNENARRSGFPLASPSREDRAGNRSSVSSEGFCENEVLH